MTDYQQGRHLKIRDKGLFMEQARLRALAQVVSDDIIYILERQEFSDDDAELLRLNTHGIESLSKRVRQNIDELRKGLTLILRQLPKEPS